MFQMSLVLAAAWTQPQGQGQVITTLTGYQSSRYFDSNRSAQNTDTYDKIELSIYSEYGVTDNTTIGLKPYIISASTRGRQTNGIGDVEIWLRQRLWFDDFGVLSAQAMLKFPGGYDRLADPALGDSQNDAEVRILFGHLLETGFGQAFYNLEAGLRKRFGMPADELRFDATLGVRPVNRWLLMAQSFNIIGLRNPGGTESAATVTGPDYDLFKVQLSVVHELTPGLELQIGGFTEYAGRNTGVGQAVFFAFWISF